MAFDVQGFPLATPVLETAAQRILRFARELISDRACWTQGGLIGAEGAMCLYGAVLMAGGHHQAGDLADLDANQNSQTIVEECSAVRLASPFLVRAVEEWEAEHWAPEDEDDFRTRIQDVRDVMEWNDSSEHDEVLAVLDRAYELAAP